MSVENSKYAVIDMGSNSLRLMLAMVDGGGRVVPLEKQIRTIRLFQGMTATHSLSEEAMSRAIFTLHEFRAYAQDAGVEAVFCFATSAVRDALNKSEFILRVHKETSLLIDCLSTVREALVSFMGTVENGPRMVVDIGGGSTEISVGHEDDLMASVSLPLGAVRATEKYPLGDIADPLALQALTQWASHGLREGVGDILKLKNEIAVDKFIGMGGTVTSAAAMDMHLDQYDSFRVQGYVLALDSLNGMLERIVKLPLEKRRILPGLQPQRADIIIGGLVILREYMKLMETNEIVASDRDNLEGYLQLKLQKGV